MTFQDTEPFSLTYTALWRLVERNQKLLELVPIGNRIKFDEANSLKEVNQDADVPELALLASGAVFKGKINRETVALTKDYVFAITTGDFRLNPIFNRVSWELFRSLSDWECVLCPLLWCECTFIKDCRLTDSQDGTMMQDLNRNLQGWSSLWNVSVDFHFPISKLRIT